MSRTVSSERPCRFKKELTRDELEDLILCDDSPLKNAFGEMDIDDAKLIGGHSKRWVLTEIPTDIFEWSMPASPGRKRAGSPPPIVFVQDGQYEVLDGKHRIAEAKHRGDEKILVYLGGPEIEKKAGFMYTTSGATTLREIRDIERERENDFPRVPREMLAWEAMWVTCDPTVAFRYRVGADEWDAINHKGAAYLDKIHPGWRTDVQSVDVHGARLFETDGDGGYLYVWPYRHRSRTRDCEGGIER